MLALLTNQLTNQLVPSDISAWRMHAPAGGHDHDYSFERCQPHGTLLVKSGTDFRDLTALTLTLRPRGPLAQQAEQQSQQQQLHRAGEGSREGSAHSGRAQQAAAIREWAACRLRGTMPLHRRTFERLRFQAAVRKVRRGL
jgi:hypothetical protein